MTLGDSDDICDLKVKRRNKKQKKCPRNFRLPKLLNSKHGPT